MGAIDRFELDAAASVRDSDLIILSTPVGAFEKVLTQISVALNEGCVVTDVGSTKRTITALAEKLLSGSVDFVGSHPMAGSEKRGVEFARADLFRSALCILTFTPATRPAALQRVEAFWRLLGVRTTQLPPEVHDRLLADVSHLPHLLAAALISMQDQRALDLCGPGFMDTTRIAGGDGALWRDILLDNASNMLQSIFQLKSRIAEVESMLSRGESEQLEQWLDRAAARRNELIGRRSKG